MRVTIDQGRRTGQDGVIRLTESCEQVTRMPNSQEAPPTGDRVGRGNLSIFLHSTARENFKLMKNGSLTIPIAHTAPVAHTGFSYGVGTVSSPGPYPEKAPPLFLFFSNLRYIIFQNDILITFCIPQKIFIKGRRSGPGAGPLRSVGEK